MSNPSKSERDIQNRIRLAVTKAGARCMRNNVGMGWTGNTSRVDANTIMIHDARPLHAGLGTGTSDLIGWLPVLITPEHVGKTLALFLAIEVKRPCGRPTPDQVAFLRAVNAAGGMAILATSDEQVTRELSPFTACPTTST